MTASVKMYKGVIDMAENVILMLSGGRDSFLAACRLLEDPANYCVQMVTYDNGCSYCSGNSKTVADRIIARYGADRASFLGVYKIGSLIRRFFFPYFNMKPEEQAKRYRGMTPSQYHCLICRTSMYIFSIWLAHKHNARYIAEGARKDQEFVIELPGMARKRYPALVGEAGLELLLPVYDLDSNWERDNELLLRGYLCKSLEPKCLIGVPVCGSVDEAVVEGIHAYYDQEMLPLIRELDLLSSRMAELHTENEYNELVP